MNAARNLTASEQTWLDVRKYLQTRRHELATAAAAEFPADMHVAETPLLARNGWISTEPIPLDSVRIEFHPDQEHFHSVTGREAGKWLPERPDGRGYEFYAEAIAELSAPSVFDDRGTYRLLDADLSTPSGAILKFGRGSYFDSINVGEAGAHEYAATHAGTPLHGVREAVGDPCDLRNRPANMAISTLTVRRDSSSGTDTFLVHWRDPAHVGHAGGFYQVVPVSIFQPSGAASWNEQNDFSLWRNMIREYEEELRGASEEHGSEHAPIDYDRWPLAHEFDQGLAAGTVQAYCPGVGVDPLTYAVDLLTAVVFKASLFDRLFGDPQQENAEGRVMQPQPLNAATIDRYVNGERIQAAGAALLQLARNLP